MSTHPTARMVELEAEVQHLTQELERSRAELAEFAYVASHDLKEPLRGIHSYATFLIEDYADALDDDGKAKLHTLQRLCERLQSLIDALLDFSRIGRVDLQPKETDLGEVLSAVTDRLRQEIDATGVELRIPEPLPRLVCDRERVGELLLHLVGNAVQYGREEAPWVEVGCARDEGGEPVLYVRDNGIGIAQKHHAAVFRIFKRLHARDEYGSGTGTGLTLSKKIVERHGGRIWLESDPDNGTGVFFTLPGRR